MRRMLFTSALSVLVLMIVSSCSSIKTHNSLCQADTEQVIKSFVSLAMQEGMNITVQDPKTGFAAAESMTTSYGSGNNKYVWQINVTPGTGASAAVNIRATAKMVTTTTNAFGAQTGAAETYPDDDFPEFHTWYWSVRKGREKVCGTAFTVNELKK